MELLIPDTIMAEVTETSVEQENIPTISMNPMTNTEMPHEDVKESESTVDADNDVEDGELPEDGEIMDEDEENVSNVCPYLPAQNSSVRPDACSADSNKFVPSAVHGSGYAMQENLKRTADSSHDLYGKRPNFSPDHYGSVHLPPRRRQPWTESVLCKFFREGYCRDGEQCGYSHNAAHSNRKPELCKFYQQGFCKKGLACTLLHGEYPCKDFHKGQCKREPCKYSHVSLNDFTKKIFEQLVQDEALASQIKIPQQPARRRVLLPRPAHSQYDQQQSLETNRSSSMLSPQTGVSLSPPNNYQSPVYSINHTAGTETHGFNDVKPESSVPDNFVALNATEDPDEALFASDSIYNSMNNEPYRPYAPEPMSYALESSISDPMSNIGSTPEPAPSSVEKAPTTVAEMFDRLAKLPPNGEPIITPAITDEEMYGLYPVNTETDYDDKFMQKITHERFKNDPRVERIVHKKFDHDSMMFKKNLASCSNNLKQSPVTTTYKARDPRIRPSDPRLNRQVGTQLSVVQTQPIQPIISTENDDALKDHFDALVQKQLQMVNDPHNNEMSSGSHYDPRTQYDNDPRLFDDTSRYRGGYSGRGYTDRNYSGRNYDEYGGRSSRFDDNNGYGGQGSYNDERYRNSRYHSASRGRGRPYEGGDHRAPRYPINDRYESRWDRDSRRDYRERDRRDYAPPPRREGGRFRDRSRSPMSRRTDAPSDDRSMKRKYDTYHGPVRA